MHHFALKCKPIHFSGVMMWMKKKLFAKRFAEGIKKMVWVKFKLHSSIKLLTFSL